MISRVFYSDKIHNAWEVVHRWYQIVERLEKLYEENKDNPIGEEIICTLIFETWYIYAIKVDGKSRYNIYDDYDFYLDRWKHYISVAQDRHFNSAAVCWIVGYTCENSGYHFDEFFKGFGQKWMRRGCKLATLEQPFDVLMGRKRRNKNDLYLIRPHLLFPSTCEADRFFLKKLGEIGITE